MKETENSDADFLIVSSVKNASVNQQQQNTCKNANATGKISLGLLGFSILLVNGGYVVIVIITARSVIMNANYVKLTVNIFYTFFDLLVFISCTLQQAIIVDFCILVKHK